MHKAYAIARREFRGYFDSPVAYIVLTVFLLVSGWIFFSTLFLLGQAEMREFFNPVSRIFFSPAMLMIIIAPAITMRLVAEEKKLGTLELITSMPIRDVEVVLGKFLAALALMGVALLLTLVYAVSVAAIGDLDWGPVVSGYLGLFLLTASLLAIGLACSAWTDNQIIAFIIAFLVSASLFFVHYLVLFVPQSVAGVVDFLSVSSHLENMARGVIDTRDVLYYLSLTAGALFVAERSLAQQHA